MATTLVAQEKVTGVVRSAANVPLFGVTVTVRGTHMATTSNSDGSFDIVAKPGDVLVISYVGYTTRQIAVRNETVFQISLVPTINDLDRVVVTGYTSQKIREIAGSVAVVDPKDLTAIPAGQVEQMLQGRVAGLTVISSGEPGAPSQVFLHGLGNFGDVRPLYIIDGIQGDINGINPYDIESLQVLKDAGAYSIYGVRGANGVIVVTTKKGKNAKTSVSYDFYIGVQEPLKRGLDILTPKEQGDLIWIADKNSHDTGNNGYPKDPMYGNGPTPVLPDYIYAGGYVGLHEGDPNADPSKYNLDPAYGAIYQIARFDSAGEDWFHHAFRPALSQNHTVSISGGNDKNKYLFSFGFLDQQGTLLNTYLKRYTTRVNTGFGVGKSFRFGENLQLSYVDNPRTNKWDAAQYSDHSDLSAILTMNPALPVYDIKGNWSSRYIPPLPWAGPMDNPIFVRTIAKDNKSNNWATIGNAYAEADFLKHFTARTSFGGSLNYYYSYNFSYGSWDPASGYPNSFSEASGYSRSWTWTNTLNYSETFGKHQVKALVGTEEISDYSRNQGGSGNNLYSNSPPYWNLANIAPRSQTVFSAATSSFLASFISHIDYNFSEKYILSGTLRRDGSSVFGPQNRFGWFPALAAAWRIGEEKFIPKETWLNELRLRASWGKTGFDGNTNPINQYNVFGGSVEDAYYDIYGTSNSIVQGLRTVNIGNSHTGWEQDMVTNLGLDAVLWNGRLSLTTDWYEKDSKGLLYPASLPALLGLSPAPNANIGRVKNKGIDLVLESKGNFSKDAAWDITMNATSYNNKILKLNVFPFFDYDTLLFTGLIRNQVGYPTGSFFGYKVIGYFNGESDISKSPRQDGAASGRFKYLDANVNGRIDDSDRIFIGDPNPKLTLGLNMVFFYKHFDFSAFLYGCFGNDVLNEFRMMNVSPFGSSKTALYDSWRPDNKNPRAPILENDYNFSNAGAVNSYPIEKGSYLKGKSIMVGYTFQKKVIERLKINGLRVYVQAVNLFTVTNYTGLDPELPGVSKAFGYDQGMYPNNQRQYLMGVNLNF